MTSQKSSFGAMVAGERRAKTDFKDAENIRAEMDDEAGSFIRGLKRRDSGSSYTS
jgi:hypothetical protein